MSTKKETENKKLEAIYNYLNEMPEDVNIDIEKQKRNFFNTINTRKTNHLFKYLKYAAAIVILLSSGYFLTIANKDQPISSPAVVDTSNDIQVGTDKATLTLEDGSNVVLEKGSSFSRDHLTSNGEQIVYNTAKNNKIKDIKSNILTIPRGGQFFITLADGTKVWLNSESQLKYPVAFTDDAPRKVELLYGEAYFEVSPSTAHNGTQFVVTTKDQDVVVLGTEFNIKAYKEDDVIATTLVEGKVTIDHDTVKRALTPNNQLQFNTITKEINVVPIDVKHEIAWRKGLFSFRNKPFKDIMRVISRWYDVDVVFVNSELKDITFNGVFNKKLSIEEILEVIENSKEAKFEIKNKTIFMK